MFLLLPQTTVAIVNMDALHFDNVNDRFTAALDLTVSASSGNSNTSKAAFNSQFSWRAKKSINLAILGFQYGESNHTRSVNKAFIHYRYIHQISDSLDWELFAQLEKNEFTRLSYRGLLGTGARFVLSKSDKHRAYLGLGGFYSKEETEFSSGLTDDGEEKLVRANLYVLSKYKINTQVSLSNVFYYQPSVDRASDYRALLETKLDLKITDELKFRINLEIEHDSNPSQTIKNTDISYMTGVILRF